jgi:ADP-heptose:LPS heptosyltransferase
MKVLLVRFSSIGDIVLTSPVIRCVKQQLKCEVHYLTKASYSELLKHNPHIDQLQEIDKEIDEILPKLRKEAYDLIIDLHNNLRSKRLAAMLAVKRIAFDKINVQKWLYTNIGIDLLPEKHLVDRYFDALKELKVKNDGLGPEYYLPEKCPLPEKWDLVENGYSVIAIGATYATKRLQNEQLLSIIKRLNIHPVIIGGPGDELNAGHISEKLDVAHSNLTGHLSLTDSASLISKCRYILCHDSGMMHIAAAFKKPIISVWGNTHPKLGMGPYLPFQATDVKPFHKEMQVELGCRPCSKLGYDSCPNGHFNCMNSQNVEEIVKNCNSVVARQ